MGLGLGTPSNPLPFARPGVPESSFTDGNGNVTTVKLNRFGSPLEIADALGRVTVLERDADDQVIRVTAPSGGELPDGSKPGTVASELDYDSRGNVIAQREAVGTALARQTLFEYEPVFNQVTRIVDAGGFETLFEYDANGNLTKTTDALLGTRVSTYDARGLKLTETDPNTNLTQFAYDLAGNLASVTDALNNVTQLATDAAGRVTARTEGLGTPEARTTAFTYDAMNRVLSETDGAGGTTAFVYDAAGNVTSETDPTGIVTVRSYDPRDRLIEEDDPVQGLVTRSYDGNGNQTSIANALGKTVTLEYDAGNRATKTIDPLLQERLFAWDAQNNLKTLTDGNSNVSTFAYDTLGRQIRRANALSETWTQAFDNRDNLTQIVDPKGQTIDRAYDDLSRLTGITLTETDGTTVEDIIAFTYDAASNRLSASDGDSDLAFTYDELNRVETAETLATAGTVQPAVVLTSLYDALGLRTELRHGPDTVTVDGAWVYSRDGAGRLTGVLNPVGDNVTLGYDPAGRLTQVGFPNQTAMDVVYGTDGRVGSVTHSLNTLPFSSFAFGYQADGLITSTVETAGTRNFTYDDTQQVLTAGFAGSPESYAYDAEGNRTASHLSAAHVTDAANRLIEDDGFCYGYDANGNLTSKTVKVAGTCTGALTTYTWDVQNRLVRIDFPGGTFAAYRYDADGRRIEKDVDGTLTRYVYNNDAIVLEYDGTNALTARFSHGEAVDQPLAMERGGQSHFYHTDFLGSVRKLTNAAGAVVNSYDYDAYGNFETRSEAVANPYTFTAREFDAESGLHYYRARYYDPTAGRFLSEDPIGLRSGDANFYRYVFNTSPNLIDPFGLQSAAQSAALFALGAAAQVTVESLIGATIACLAVRVADILEEAAGGNLIEGLCAGPSKATIVASSPPNQGGGSQTGSGSPSTSAPGDPDDDKCKPGPRAKFSIKSTFVGAIMIVRATLSVLSPFTDNFNESGGPGQTIQQPPRERRPRPGCDRDPPR